MATIPCDSTKLTEYTAEADQLWGAAKVPATGMKGGQVAAVNTASAGQPPPAAELGAAETS